MTQTPETGTPEAELLQRLRAAADLLETVAADKALLDTLPFYLLVAWLRRWLDVPGAGAELEDLGSP